MTRVPRFTRLGALVGAAALFCMSPAAIAGQSDGHLDIYWTDVEGGAATLIVTPTGESILIDAGMPEKRTRDRSDPKRIARTITKIAKLERLDHMIVSHFDIDHFGGVAALSKLVPIGAYHHPGIPDEHLRRMPDLRVEFEEASKGKRSIMKAGDVMSLKKLPSGAPRLQIRCLAAKQRFIDARPDAKANATICADHRPKSKDLSENANSIVLVLAFGSFRFFDGTDLTWNLESRLVCPTDLVGKVDVYQSDHHGLDRSNNPVLIRTLEPKVAIINNGPRKGCEPGMFKTLKNTPSVEAIYQLHRNVRVGDDGNAPAEYIANHEAKCDAEIVKLSLAPDGKSYTVSVPSTGHSKTYSTR